MRGLQTTSADKLSGFGVSRSSASVLQVALIRVTEVQVAERLASGTGSPAVGGRGSGIFRMPWNPTQPVKNQGNRK